MPSSGMLVAPTGNRLSLVRNLVAKEGCTPNLERAQAFASILWRVHCDSFEHAEMIDYYNRTNGPPYVVTVPEEDEDFETLLIIAFLPANSPYINLIQYMMPGLLTNMREVGKELFKEIREKWGINE